jgi:hypothetical protein
MNKNIKKNILIQSTKSFDKMNESKKSSASKINFNDFLNDYFKEKGTFNLSKYVKKVFKDIYV